MRSLETIQTLTKIGKILSKIAFVFSVVGFCGCILGMLSLSFGNGGLVKIGGVTLHSLISENLGYNLRSVTAALSGWLIVCAGEAVLAKFAEICFKNELMVGTPFTLRSKGNVAARYSNACYTNRLPSGGKYCRRNCCRIHEYRKSGGDGYAF